MNFSFLKTKRKKYWKTQKKKENWREQHEAWNSKKLNYLGKHTLRVLAPFVEMSTIGFPKKNKKKSFQFSENISEKGNK